MKYYVDVVILVLAFTSLTKADSLYFKLPALKISQIENGKPVAYDFDIEKVNFILTDSSLIADPKVFKYNVEIDKIEKITIYKEHNVAPAFVLGFGFGALLGYYGAGANFHGSNHGSTGQRILGIVLGGTILGLITGGISLLISHNDVFDIKGINTSEKRKMLLNVFKKVN